ncbi:alpha/beta hydrolase family esterase [Phaeobacter italicus]|uniref:alpha/beta hydrolase family esterase n=1 Tax=Phaeobacter italicus TaxID=481446 RepID=UPI002FDD339F
MRIALTRSITQGVAGMALFAAGAISASPVWADCGTVDAACEIESGTYHIALPERAGRARIPAVMFLHGYGSSGAAVLRNETMISELTDRGYAVIAPTALPREEDGPRSWAFLSSFGRRDEGAFFEDVMGDVAGRFNVDQEDVVLAGFSAGGFMTVYLACAHPDQFRAYAPVSGGFWRPQPESCAGPVRLLHTHGWADQVVPLEGRYIGGGRFQQGDIFAGLELWRQTNECATHAPDRRWKAGDQLRRAWDCGEGRDIELILVPGGHSVPKGWGNWMLDWYEGSDLSQ